MIDRNLDDLGGNTADGLERARRVEPVEAEDDVGCANCVGRLGSEHGATGRASMEIMWGGKRGGDLEIGDNARVQPLGEGDALVPGIDIARCPSGKDYRLLCIAQEIGGLLDGRCRRRARDRRHETLGVDSRHGVL